MFILSKKILIPGVILFLFTVAGLFLYIQFLFTQLEEGQTASVRYSREYDCQTVVESRAEAAECFNGFFKERLKEIELRGGELEGEAVDTYGEVSEEDIFIFEGLYQIDRSGYGSYYFIKDGTVMLQKE